VRHCRRTKRQEPLSIVNRLGVARLLPLFEIAALLACALALR
jgi:hypothetical protein